MVRLIGLVATFLMVTTSLPVAQDARAVLQATAEALGVTNMTSIQYSGTGWLGAVGQNFAPADDLSLIHI